ncbi:uncharacterized protein LAESUDRAFT_59831 [Laetiporus sulphureus 93-53]|uniref:Uncharacterized protein n=1 Tax=Laetiporus sulphureus 93-53 TaxID=1314785 RepID=A0A165AY77_9APHY|nr:uncharacterized protein LAESUDRAFT_59831 [Laetiporus sulphureus 93-53]KZS99881.1 hypothetical protein LAESUDRAFT_59831 [Laetiporus sulphureus 93-53]
MTDNVTSASQTGVFQVDHKRRKLTPERAKANYLSGQLRLRLQYAKLKVEHGWQRQNLNEVENLYFRHTHRNRPSPTVSSGGRRNTGANALVLTPNTIFPVNEYKQDQLAQSGLLMAEALNRSVHQLAASTSSNTPSTSTLASPGHTYVNRSTPLSPFSHVASQANEQQPSSSTPQPSSTLPTAAETTTSEVNLTEQVPPGASPALGNMSPVASTTPTNLPVSDDQTQTDQEVSPSQPVSSSIEHPSQPQAAPSPAATVAAPSAPAQSSPTLSDSVGPLMNPGVTLTYDAFWSSHSLSTQAYRNVLFNSMAFGAPAPDPRFMGSQPAFSAAAAMPMMPIQVSQQADGFVTPGGQSSVGGVGWSP